MEKKTKNVKGIILLCLCALIVVMIVAIIILAGRKKEKKQTVIGYISTGSISENGWNGTHYNAINKVCEKNNYKLIIKENVKENTGECEKAIKELAKQGATIIVLNSYNYADEAKDVIKKYSDINFLVNSAEYTDDNISTYFVRMYQTRYLAGIAAGYQTKTNHIGYVAAMSNSEVNRGINAFTLGVKSVNPDAVVDVIYTGDWDNESVERASAKELINKYNVDVISYHQNQSYVIEVANEAGIYSIGYNQDDIKNAGKCFATIVGNWDMVYDEIIKDNIQGKQKNKKHYWLGLEKEAVEFKFLTSDFSVDVMKAVNSAIDNIKSGNDVFSGEIKDNTGKIRCKSNESIDDEVLLSDMEWLVEGVLVHEK